MKRRSLLGLSALAALPLAGCKTYRSDDTPPPVQSHQPPAPSSGAPAEPAAVLEGGGTVPYEKGKVLLGAYTQLKGLTTAEGLALRKKELGRPPRIVHRFYSWTDSLPVSLPYVTSKSTLMVSWEGPYYKQVNNGSSDKRIAKAARRIAERKVPTLLRWGWDMNRDYYDWGGPANNQDTAGYVKAYRRIHQIFADEGARNVSWVWSPNWNSYPDADWNALSHYYPGDEYVDWAGVSGYAESQTPGEMFDEFYETYSARKPIMITEVSATDRGGSTKPDWITSFHQWVKTRPAVGAVSWFDTDIHPGSTEKWRIDSTAAALKAYQAMSADPLFNG
ncbi:glycosyl hydrolase [Actinoplanes sp. NPDC049596]|uniref:glycoside hydrolase family 26 protein n=1 Tax=unclassified Actinoplanes TaxID=2626549 RepID=UPI00343818F1